MPAHEDDATYTGAGVRKPPKEETAGRDTSDGAACAIEDGVARNLAGNFRRTSGSNTCTTLALWHEYCCCTFGSESQIIFIPLLALPLAAAPYRASGLVHWHL